MAEAVVGSLVYQFKGDVSNLTDSLKLAQAQISTFNDNVKSTVKETSKGFDDVSGAFKGVSEAAKIASEAVKLSFEGIGVAAGTVLAKVLTNTIQQIGDIKNIISKSESSGVSSNLFQNWTEQAKQLRISTEDAEKAIMSAASALKGQLNPITENQGGSLAKSANSIASLDGRTAGRDALEQARTLDQMHQAALLIVKDYEDAAKAAREQGLEITSIQRELDAVRIATSLWGEAGKDVANSIKDGTLNVEEFGKKGSEAAKWPQDIIDAQKKVNDELTDSYTKLKDQLEPHYESLVRLCIQMESVWASIVDRIAEAIKNAKELFNSSMNWLASWTKGTEVNGANAQGRSIDAFERDIGLKKRTAYGPEIPAGPTMVNAPSPPKRPEYIAEMNKRISGGSGGAARKEAEDSVQRYIDKLSKAAEAAKAETETWSLGNIERTKAVELAKAEEIAKAHDQKLSEAERQTIAEKATLLAQSKNSTDQLRQSQQALNSAMQEFSGAVENAFETMIIKGGKASDVLRNLMQTLSSSALKSLFTGVMEGKGIFGNAFGMGAQNGQSGGILGMLTSGISSASGGGLFGGLTSLLPKFAEGGSLGAGKWGIAGEAGPELVQGPASISPMGGNNGKVIINNYAGAEVSAQRLSSGDVVVMIQQALNQYSRKVPGLVADAQRRSI